MLSHSVCVSGETSCREPTRLFMEAAKPFGDARHYGNCAARDSKPIAVMSVQRGVKRRRHLNVVNQNFGARCKARVRHEFSGARHDRREIFGAGKNHWTPERN